MAEYRWLRDSCCLSHEIPARHDPLRVGAYVHFPAVQNGYDLHGPETAVAAGMAASDASSIVHILCGDNTSSGALHAQC